MGSRTRRIKRNKPKKAHSTLAPEATQQRLPDAASEPKANAEQYSFNPPPPAPGIVISLCMIVRDEAKRIARCFDSVRGLVDEIIVIDTGSCDETPAIAKSYGAAVESMSWRDDFAWARNESLKRARGEWILILDGDECLNPKDHAKIRNLIASGTNNCWMLTQRHYSNEPRYMGFSPIQGENPEFEGESLGFFESSLVRLFPNRKGIYYRNRIHELVEPRIEEIPGLVIRNSGIRIHHYGHLETDRWQSMKKSLYQKLGEVKVREGPKSWKAHFELAVEHSCSNRHAEAVASFVSSLALNPEYTDSWINIGFVLGEARVLPLAIASLREAIRLDPNAAEAYQNLGVMYMRLRSYHEAVPCFERAIQLAPNHVVARCNLAESFIILQEIEKARAIYQFIIDKLPDYRKAWEGLATCAALSGNRARLRETLGVITKSRGPDDSRLFLILANLARSKDLLDEAKECITLAAARLNESGIDDGSSVAEFMRLEITKEDLKIDNAILARQFVDLTTAGKY